MLSCECSGSVLGDLRRPNPPTVFGGGSYNISPGSTAWFFFLVDDGFETLNLMTEMQHESTNEATF